MKKFLLLAAVVAAAFAGNAQDLQLTKAWQTTAPALANTRQGIALDGKFIINDKVAGTLTAYDANGATPFGVTEATGSFPAIAKDQAGNIIVRVDNNWPGAFKADTILFKIYGCISINIKQIGRYIDCNKFHISLCNFERCCVFYNYFIST